MKQKILIVIVDDEPNVSQIVGYALKAEGYEVCAVESGLEALNRVHTECPDLMILDIMLPDISGLEVCQQLREEPEFADLPIIMFSARTQVPDKIKGLEAGADEYVTKPADTEEIVARVKGLLGRKRILRRVRETNRGKVIGFMGVKGGVGTTTVALNVASALANPKTSVIALEFRPYYGSFSMQTRQSPVENLGNLLELEPGKIDERELHNRLTNTPFGVNALFGPQEGEQLNEIEPNRAQAIIQGYATMADYVIIDLPCQPSAASQTAIRNCDFVAMVMEHDPTNMIPAKVTLELLKSWDAAAGLVGVVLVNRSVLPIPVDTTELRLQLGCSVFGVVPPAAETCIKVQELGESIVRSESKSLAAGALVEIASNIAEKLGAEKITAVKV